MKLRLPRLVRSILIAICAVLLMMSGFLAAWAVNPGEIDRKVPRYAYNQIANVDYRAYLLPNSLYAERTLGPGMAYVTPFVEYINTFFTYEFSGQRPAEIKGDYEVSATIEARDMEAKKVIWQREFPLVAKTGFSASGEKASVQRELPLRLVEFNAFLKKVAEEAKFNPGLVRMVVRWTVNVEAQTDSGLIKDKLMPTMVIPMGINFFEVGGELTNSKPGAIERTIRATPPVNEKLAMLFKGLFAVAAASLAVLRFLTAEPRKVDPMQVKLKQILKTHADRLVAIDKEIRAGADQIMPVKSIEDLIRIADELGRPIIYEGKGSASASFYVMDGNRVFAYEFGSATDLYDPSPVNSVAHSRAVDRTAKPSARI